MTALFAQITSLTPATLDFVNNAGIVAPKATIQDLVPARVSVVFQVNLIGAIDVARHAVASMRAHHVGGIVNVSSTAARKGVAHEYIDYAPAKPLSRPLLLVWPTQLASEGIRVKGGR